MRFTAFQGGASNRLRDQHWNHDIHHHRDQQCVPGHDDRGDAKQQSHQRREGEHHDRVVERNLRQGEQRITVGQPTPDEDHGCAGRCREQNEPGHVTVELLGWQIRRKELFHEEPGEHRHRKRFDQPVHKQRDTDAAAVHTQLAECAKVDADQHRNDHHPDEQTHGQIDAGDLDAADDLHHLWKSLAERDADHDAQPDP